MWKNVKKKIYIEKDKLFKGAKKQKKIIMKN
jgi:hypothetical protein